MRHPTSGREIERVGHSDDERANQPTRQREREREKERERDRERVIVCLTENTRECEKVDK
jgi:hypothetical protein